MQRKVEDRRSKPRFEILGDLWGHLDTSSPMVLRNVGRDGALLEASVPLEAGSTQWISVLLAGQPHLVQVRVRHSRREQGLGGQTRFLIGVEYVNVPAPVRHLSQRLSVGLAST